MSAAEESGAASPSPDVDDQVDYLDEIEAPLAVSDDDADIVGERGNQQQQMQEVTEEIAPSGTEDRYHCSLCNMEFVSVDEHVRMFHFGSDVLIKADDPLEPEALSCKICDYRFTSNVDREIHYQVQHDMDTPGPSLTLRTADKNKPLELLPKSSKVAAAAKRPRNQKKRKTDADVTGMEKPDASAFCEVCSTMFPSVKNLKLHMRMHLPPKQITLEDVIKYEASKLVHPEAPTDTEAQSTGADAADGAALDDPTKFYCEQCDKSYGIEHQTIHEQSHAHSNDSLHRCVTCNIRFDTLELLDMHKAAHRERKFREHDRGDTPLPYVCGYCGKAFARPHEKVKHERIHTGEKPHACEICGKTFRVAFCLTLHMRSHSDARPYVCPHCNKRYKSQSVYTHHLQTHSDARPYQCPYCPKAFKTAVQQAGHKNSHTKPFPCGQCNRPFSTLFAVKLHLATHQSKQQTLKHVCRVCGAAYTRAFAVKSHMLEMHPDEPDAQGDDPAAAGTSSAAASTSGGPAKRRATKRRATQATDQEEEEAEAEEEDDEEQDPEEVDDAAQSRAHSVGGMDDMATICKTEQELQIDDNGDVMVVETGMGATGADDPMSLGEIGEHFVGEEIVVDWMK